MKHLLKLLIVIVASFGSVTPTLANDEVAPVSSCMAIAQNQAPFGGLPVIRASTGLSAYDIAITYVGHSTFRLENANGLKIATDFTGYAGKNIVPDVATMNNAHATHYTLAPDPRIPHVLRGWGENGEPAKHFLTVEEALIRNVTTNIENNWVGFRQDGNSIFIFEMGGLCIGHLGHLHHKLTEAHYAQIGRLDVVMVPVDGGHTLNVVEMAQVVKRLRASMVLPMHWFGTYS